MKEEPFSLARLLVQPPRREIKPTRLRERTSGKWTLGIPPKREEREADEREEKKREGEGDFK